LQQSVKGRKFIVDYDGGAGRRGKFSKSGEKGYMTGSWWEDYIFFKCRAKDGWDVERKNRRLERNIRRLHCDQKVTSGAMAN